MHVTTIRRDRQTAHFSPINRLQDGKSPRAASAMQIRIPATGSRDPKNNGWHQKERSIDVMADCVQLAGGLGTYSNRSFDTLLAIDTTVRVGAYPFSI
jgi:hypothetical protein